jgi:DNA-binding IclR family transcriptional regulator
VRFGRPTALTAFQRAEALRRHDAGEAATEIARSFNVDRATVYRMLARPTVEQRP